MISNNEVSRWHNPVQYGSNTVFFLELGSDGPPPPGGGMDKGGGGAGHGGARVQQHQLGSIAHAVQQVWWQL